MAELVTRRWGGGGANGDEAAVGTRERRMKVLWCPACSVEEWSEGGKNISWFIFVTNIIFVFPILKDIT